MKFCGCTHNVDCDNCINYSIPYCPLAIINIPVTNLLNGQTYYLWVVDKFGNAYSSIVVGKTNGSFDILQSDFTVGLFSNNFGKLDIYITTDIFGYNIQSLTYGGVTANCLLLKIDSQVKTPATWCPTLIPDCSTCFNYSLSYCENTLNIPTTNLISGNNYYLWIVDKFNRLYKDSVIANSDGSFNINKNNFPNGMFNVGFGKRDAFLTTDSQGNNIQILNYGGKTYNCVIIKVDEPVALADNCFVLVDTNGKILVDG